MATLVITVIVLGIFAIELAVLLVRRHSAAPPPPARGAPRDRPEKSRSR